MLVMLALRSGSGTHVPVFTPVRLMLVMLALRPGSGMLWPEEGRLMLMMPAFQPVSEIFAEQLVLMMPALDPRSCIFCRRNCG